MEIIYDNILNISDKFIKEKGFDIKEMGKVYDPQNNEWNEHYLKNITFVEHNNELLRKLENKHYWAIHYILKKESNVVKGGGIWIFIDQKKGDVILYFLEK